MVITTTISWRIWSQRTRSATTISMPTIPDTAPGIVNVLGARRGLRHVDPPVCSAVMLTEQRLQERVSREHDKQGGKRSEQGC